MQRNGKLPSALVRACMGLALSLAASAVAAEAVEAEDLVSTDAVAADVQLAGKLGHYIECINRHSNWTLGSRTRYFDWLKSPQKGPTGREAVIYGLYPLYELGDCRAGIDAAAQLSPAAPAIEQAASEWINALTALNPVVAEANLYYELENYRDDKMAKGKALHPQLLAAFARFEAANDTLYAQVVATQDGLAARRLARLAEDPQRRAEYLIANLIETAKAMLASADGAGSKGFDREALAAAVGAYEQAYLALDSYRQANPQDKRQALQPYLLFHPALELLKSAKSLARREREGFRFSAGERMFVEDGSGEMVEGHPAHLSLQYNRFIDAINTFGHR